MTDVQNTPNAPAVDQEVAIATLKKRADTLGISYKSNVSVAHLQKLIDEKLNPESESAESKADKPKVKTTEDYVNEAMKLRRVIITPMESHKAANMESDVFCAGNGVVGTVKRIIRFNEPWHVEEILLNTIREKRYQLFISKKDKNGAPVVQNKLVPAYSISVLPDLTDEELKELADMQLRTGSTRDDD